MIGIIEAFKSAMILEDFCQQQDDCYTCIFHVSHQAHHDDFSFKDDYGSSCLLNRTYPENWCIGCVRGEREGKTCDNCKHLDDDSKICNDCRHCIEKWELKESEENNGKS